MKKIEMICILKSGQVLTETLKFRRKDSLRVHTAIEDMRISIERYLANPNASKGQITFGKLTIAASEIAAISFKD